MSLSNIIKKIREELKVSQEQFARELNISFSTINRWENNKGTPSLLAKELVRVFCQQNKSLSSEIIIELKKLIVGGKSGSC